MPSYKAPVEDVKFLLNDVFHIDRYANLPGFSDASPDVVEAILGEAAKLCEQVLTPLNRVGDKEGCKRASDGSVTTPTGFKDAFKQIVDGGWIGISAPPEFGGQGLPMIMTQIVNEFLCSANMAFAMYPGLTQGAIAALHRARLGGAEGRLSAEDDRRRVDRHDEPHRAALRHGPGPAPHQGGEAGRRQLQDHRHQDLHLGRRARSRRQHHPSRAGPHRRRARGHARHLAVHRAEVPAEARRLARRAQRRDLRLARREDGHPRQLDLRDELRRRHRLAARRGEPRPQRHVHDDERGAARRRHAGPRPVRGRLPERRRLRQGAPAGPRAHRREVQGQAGRSDHRASRRAPHADDDQVASTRRRARSWSGPRSRPTSTTAPRTRRPARRPTTTWAC